MAHGAWRHRLATVCACDLILSRPGGTAVAPSLAGCCSDLLCCSSTCSHGPLGLLSNEQPPRLYSMTPQGPLYVVPYLT